MVTRKVVTGFLVVAVWLQSAGCELEEVTIPGGEAEVVVHGVLRSDRQQQFIVVEQSFDGVVDPLSVSGPIPPSLPRIPITGATVLVTSLDNPNDPCGNPVVFTEDPADPRRIEVAGVYWAPRSCPAMSTGDRFELIVETPGGDTVTGTTQLPGMSMVHLFVGGDSLTFDLDSATTFNRDRDTVRIRIDALGGRLLQFENRRNGYPDDLGTKIFVDTTAVTLPGDLIDVFYYGSGEDVFNGGRSYAMTAALSDTNYYDFARSRNNQITGRGFINHLVGGIGVFGSLVSQSTRVWVVSDIDDEREGHYRLQGQVQGADIDVMLSIYLKRPLPDTELSAFMNGDWIRYGIVGPDGAEGFDTRTMNGESLDGQFVADSLFVQEPFRQDATIFALRGIWASDAPFTLEVGELLFNGFLVRGTVTATKQ